MRLHIIPLILCALLLAACGGSPTVTALDGGIQVTLPAGWTSSVNFASIVMSNNGSTLNLASDDPMPDNAVLVVLSSNPYAGSSSPFEALNQTNSDNSEIIDFRAGENVASRLYTADEAGDIGRFAVQVPDGRIFLMIAQSPAGQLAGHTEALVSIAASLTALSPVPTPTPSPFPTLPPEATVGP